MNLLGLFSIKQRNLGFIWDSDESTVSKWINRDLVQKNSKTKQIKEYYAPFRNI